MAAATVKKIINERLSYKNVTLSLPHLHVESYVLQLRKQKLAFGGTEELPMRRMPQKWGSWLRLGSREQQGIFVSWCNGDLSTTLQQCTFDPGKSFLRLCLPQRGQPASLDTYQQAADVQNAGLPCLIPQALSPLGLKGNSEGLDDPGSCETPSACCMLDTYPRQSN